MNFSQSETSSLLSVCMRVCVWGGGGVGLRGINDVVTTGVGGGVNRIEPIFI